MDGKAASYRCGVLTISTGCAEGTREDRSGALARELLAAAGFTVAMGAIVPDDALAISGMLTRWTDVEDLPLIVTSGGTGLSPYDLTPEATRTVLHREVPGMAEAMRAGTLAATPTAMLSRGVVGTRAGTLIVNLPGSPNGVRECLAVIVGVLTHAIAILRQDQTGH